MNPVLACIHRLVIMSLKIDMFLAFRQLSSGFY